ncbi:hypothetical protein [Parabacteroides bouchesdurhonensis]|uniref:hypothetical protein n=1 Tax=Parabacteroides bouchesdurhonensis TaxID=1936995 RepID=UPI000C832F2F|nr:hypothetical protein [Parabacteroides bouchesdurhonensis]
MNTSEEHIDKLTKKLMNGTFEQPSPSLNTRIMALIMGEKRSLIRKCYIKRMPSLSMVIGCFVVYMMLIAGVASLFMKQSETMSNLLEGLKNIFPMLLTIGTCVSLFFFFTQLDNWLNTKESMKTNVGKKIG